MGFASLQHVRDRRSTSRRPCLGPLCSAFRVWLPSWRFTPFGLSPALFRAGSARGIHPSKLSPLEEVSERFRSNAPTYCFAAMLTEVQAPSRHGCRSFWVLTFLRVPGGSHVFSTLTAGCSHGFLPSRVVSKCLDQDFARSPLTRFSAQA